MLNNIDGCDVSNTYDGEPKLARRANARLAKYANLELYLPAFRLPLVPFPVALPFTPVLASPFPPAMLLA